MSNRVAPGETIPTTSQLDAIHHTSALALNNEEQPIRKDQIVVVNWKLDKDTIQIVIEQIHCNVNLSSPYVKVTLGDQVFRTSCSRDQQGNWNETFLLCASFHTQLFGTIQIDLFDSLMLWDSHIGRAELKLNLLFGLPQDLSSWYELWRKDLSYSSISAVRRRTALSQNVGAIKIKVKQAMSDEYDSDLFKKLTDFDYPVDIVTLDELWKESPRAQNIEPLNLTVEPTPTQRRFSRSLCREELEKETELDEAEFKESLEFLYHEDKDEHPNEKPVASTLVDKIGDLVLSKETSKVVKSIRRVLAAYGQGLELTNAQLISGINILEKYYINHEMTYTGKNVRCLSQIEQPRHFYSFAMAAYGWKGLNFFGKGAGIIKDSTRKDADRKAVLDFLKLPDANLLAFELTTVEIFRPSYFVAIDDITNSIVLTIRGTMSATDTLTDLVCEYVPWKDGVVHEGVKTSADWFFQKVIPKLQELVEQHDLPHLVICGHSLGAATASILTMMVSDQLFRFKRKNGSCMTIHCYAFAPPPVVSLNLSRRYKNLIDSFVVEDDIICRMSYGHMMDLKSMIIAAVHREKKPSWLSNIQATVSMATTGAFASPPLNDIALCRELLHKQENPRYLNVKLYLAGTIYFLYYENKLERPFASLVPRYTDLDYEEVHRAVSPHLYQEPPSVPSNSTEPNSSAPDVALIVTSNEPSSSPAKESSPSKSPMKRTIYRGPSTSPSKSIRSKAASRSDSPIKNKPLKRVLMEESDPSHFDEIILKRTVFLEHIPNVYDKALHRAFETLMLDLNQPSDFHDNGEVPYRS